MSATDVTSPTAADPVQQLPLHALHARHRARFAPFAGYAMPVSYTSILDEHRHTRAAASLFDVSHMGQITLRPPRAPRGEPSLSTLANALEALLPADLLALPIGRQRYSLLLNDGGGIRDDLMVANLGQYFLLVVNAANKSADYEYLRQRVTSAGQLQLLTDRVLLALQGPRAEEVLRSLSPAVADLRFMDARELPLVGAPCWVTRSGYTGEDGFEISAPPQIAEELVEALLAGGVAKLAGLGARDSLRLEAGLPLHGADIDEATTPVQAGLSWAIAPARRAGGARAGQFPGADVILPQISHGTPHQLTGLRGNERPVRGGAPIFAALEATEPLGQVTSGTFGASLAAPVSLAYLDSRYRTPGTVVWAGVRDRRLPLTVTPLPFCASQVSTMTLYYTSTHEWIRIEADIATVGISDHAQSQLGDVVFVSLPALGRTVRKGEEIAVIESVKTAADVYAPLTGTVLEANTVIPDNPALVNSDPLGTGWLFRLRIGPEAEISSLLSEADYQGSHHESH